MRILNIPQFFTSSVLYLFVSFSYGGKLVVVLSCCYYYYFFLLFCLFFPIRFFSVLSDVFFSSYFSLWLTDTTRVKKRYTQFLSANRDRVHDRSSQLNMWIVVEWCWKKNYALPLKIYHKIQEKLFLTIFLTLS